MLLSHTPTYTRAAWHPDQLRCIGSRQKSLLRLIEELEIVKSNALQGVDLSIVTKAFVPGQWQEWADIRLEALKSHPEAFGSSAEQEEKYSESEIRARISGNTIYGAWLNNKLVGTAGFFQLDGPKMRHRGCMFGMYVTPSARGSGTSTALVSSILDCARETVEQLHCTVVTTNRAAIKLYLRQGFDIYGTEPRSLKVGEDFYDEHMMVHMLK